MELMRAADDAAAEWLLLQERALTDEENGRFEEWLGSSDAHADAWARACLIWSEFDLEPDAQMSAMLNSARTLRRPVWQSLPFQGTAVAASILLCLGLAFQTIPPAGNPHRSVPAAVAATVHYGSTTRRSVTLPDGSRVQLDARSQLTFSDDGLGRRATLLAGQAYFKVAHDARKPFSVAAGDTTVTATGTEFSVSKAPDLTDVVLVKGAVTVSSGAERSVVKLVPGRRYRAFRGNAGRVEAVDVDDALAWRSGYIAFRNVTIGEAVDSMNRFSDTVVRVGDPEAASLRITGQFKADPIRFVDALSELYPVALKRSPTGVIEIVSTARETRR